MKELIERNTTKPALSDFDEEKLRLSCRFQRATLIKA